MRQNQSTYSRFFTFGIAVVALIHCAAPTAKCTVIYRGLQNIAIPTDFTGIYLNLDSGVSSVAEFTGWDINPFFGGVGFANSPAFQPARIDTANESAILALGSGALVGGSLLFSAENGGSQTHLGAGPSQFGIGQEAYLGFRFTTDSDEGPYYGWMRVIFTANTPGGIIKDWAYENSGLSTSAGNVLQTTPIGSVSSVFLSGESGEDSTLGPLPNNLGSGVSLAISKFGSGTWSLTTPGSYSSLATSGGTLNVSVEIPDGNVTASGDSAINFEVSQTLTSLIIADGATVGLTTFETSSAPENFAAPFASPTTSVPEPGSVLLIAACLPGLLARSRRRL